MARATSAANWNFRSTRRTSCASSLGQPLIVVLGECIQPRSGESSLAGCRQGMPLTLQRTGASRPVVGLKTPSKNTGRLAPRRYLQPELSGIGRQGPVWAARAFVRPCGPTQNCGTGWYVAALATDGGSND